MQLGDRLRGLLRAGKLDLPLPGSGNTEERHRRLAAFGRDDVSLARLIEAHTDAVAILAESNRSPHPGALYGVWASESPAHQLTLSDSRLTGSKAFCSGLDLVDRALVTVQKPQHLLVEVDLRAHPDHLRSDPSPWHTHAFADTRTGTITFEAMPLAANSAVGGDRWYLERPGFWNGACGPACCWAGGAAGLQDYALRSIRDNPHDVAHLGAISAAVWAMEAAMEKAGREIDQAPSDTIHAQRLALQLRQTIEQACTGILSHFARACGPRALAFDEQVGRRFQEVQLYIRQCHAERDLQALGKVCLESARRDEHGE